MNEHFWEKVFKQNYGALTSYGHTILKSKAAAEDVVQKLFLKILENKKHVFKDENEIRPYLFKSVYNNCMNEIRNNGRMERISSQTENKHSVYYENGQSVFENQELNNKIISAIQQLPEKCKLAFEYSRNENLSYPQIAEKMQVSVKTVEAHIGKALRSLRVELAEYLIVTLPFILF